MAGNSRSGNRTGVPRKSVPRPQTHERKKGRPFSCKHLDDQGLFNRIGLSKTDAVNRGLELLGLLALHASNGDERAISYLNLIDLAVIEDRLEPIKTQRED